MPTNETKFQLYIRKMTEQFASKVNVYQSTTSTDLKFYRGALLISWLISQVIFLTGQLHISEFGNEANRLRRNALENLYIAINRLTSH